MRHHQFRTAALSALAAWSLAGVSAPGEPLTEVLEAACLPGAAASPGTMTQMGIPCPEGTGPADSIGLVSPPPTAGVAGIVGPSWNRTPVGASGVSGSSKMTGTGEPADGAGGAAEAAGTAGYRR